MATYRTPGNTEGNTDSTFHEIMAREGMRVRLPYDYEYVGADPYRAEYLRGAVIDVLRSENLLGKGDEQPTQGFRDYATQLLGDTLLAAGIRRGGRFALRGRGYMLMTDEGRNRLLSLNSSLQVFGTLRSPNYTKYPAQPDSDHLPTRNDNGWPPGFAVGPVLDLENVAVCESEPFGNIILRADRFRVPLELESVHLYQVCADAVPSR